MREQVQAEIAQLRPVASDRKEPLRSIRRRI